MFAYPFIARIYRCLSIMGGLLPTVLGGSGFVDVGAGYTGAAHAYSDR